MKRRSVKIIKSRLEDVEVGDVVNRQPDAEMGWFTVNEISTLFNGHLQLADETEQLTVSGDHKDMVGLQLVEEVQLDDRGLVMPPAAPTMTVAPMATPVPEAARSASATEADIDDILSPLTGRSSGSDLEAEAAAAAAVATNMEAPAGVPDGVNLALVAELLEDLDVGDAATITAESAGKDEPGPARALPEGAQPVYGDRLPETPSYANPVVVPEGTQLPRRSRAA